MIIVQCKDIAQIFGQFCDLFRFSCTLKCVALCRYKFWDHHCTSSHLLLGIHHAASRECSWPGSVQFERPSTEDVESAVQSLRVVTVLKSCLLYLFPMRSLMLLLIYFPCRAVSFFCPLPTPMPCFADMSGFWLGLVLIYALYCGLYWLPF